MKVYFIAFSIFIVALFLGGNWAIKQQEGRVNSEIYNYVHQYVDNRKGELEWSLSEADTTYDSRFDELDNLLVVTYRLIRPYKESFSLKEE